jgi:hypothetical protein
MRKRRQPNTLPPGGINFYVVEETNTRFENRVFDYLVEEVKTHMRSNEIVIPDNLPEVIEDFICRNVPENYCKGTYEEGKEQKRMFSTASIRNFTDALVNFSIARLKGQPVHVDQKEANRRAQICLNCPLNDKAACSTCNQLEGIIRKAVGAHRKTKLDNDLGVCTVCGCMLRVKLHLSKYVLKLKRKKDMNQYPDHCWLKKDLE